MNNKEWFEKFDNSREEFQIMFEDAGFTEQWEELVEYRHHNDIYKMKELMVAVWGMLPETYFGIQPKVEYLELCDLIDMEVEEDEL